jgi:8-oxo-dGTP pyrophosphatase MutT (NUDIX family)
MENIAEILSQRKRKIIIDENFGSAAVILLFYEKNGECYIIFTKRTESVAYHKGQISFPGGARDEEDASLKDTAIRETFEEIGINPDDIDILGALDDVYTITSKYSITPFVGKILYPYEFDPNKEEVEEIIEIPVSSLENDRISFKYGDHLIWGATAMILTQFLSLLGC